MAKLPFEERNNKLKGYYDRHGRRYTRYNRKTQGLPKCWLCLYIGDRYSNGRCGECCALEPEREKCYYTGGKKL